MHFARTMKFAYRASCLVLFAAVLFAVSFARADFSSYCDLTVAGYDANRPALLNFTVLVRISETGITGFSYSQLQADGKDLAFTSIDGNTTYPHEIDTWNKAGESLVWVLLPSMENGTIFRMNWGDDSITTAPAYTTSGQMWVDAGYVGVWHLNDADPNGWSVGTLVDGITGYSRDSTANALHGTNNVYSSSVADGAVGRARNVAETSHAAAGVCVPGWAAYMTSNWNANFTASVWIRHQGASISYDSILGTKSTLTGKVNGWAFGNTTSYSQLTVYGAGSANKNVSSIPGSKQGGGWHKLDVLYGSTRDVYTNGAPLSVGTTGASPATNSGLPLGIGTYPDATGGGWLGDLDEVRISSAVRSADWIAADYATAADSAFLSYGSVVSDAASLVIIGDPVNLGTADPAYGTITSIAAGDSFQASVSEMIYDASGVERWICTGYTHYEVTDPATGAKAARQTGSEHSFSYTHIGRDELVWHFTNEWLVAVGATAGGSVSVGETWVLSGESMTVTATPEPGFDFWGWIGDTDGVADTSSATIMPTIVAARSLKAVFVPTGADAAVQYVAETGSDENSGYLPESPKLTIQSAVDTLAMSLGRGTVRVAKGLYVIYDAIMLTNAVAVVGATGNPEDVVIRAAPTNGTDNRIALRVNHPGASAASMVIENAHRYAPGSNPYGGNVAIESAGGTVSNCVIRGAVSAGNYARGSGAWLNSDVALLTHCIITNNIASGSGYQTSEGGFGGLFVHVEKGTVANCLIANNRDSGGTDAVGQEKQSWSCGVTVRKGVLLNCTVVTNEARYTGGIYLYPEGYATNVAVAGCVNRCTFYVNDAPKFTDVGFSGTIANASYCASDGGEALDSTCVAGTAAEFFADFAGGGYQLAKNSPLRNKGIEYDDIAEFDLLGKKRVQGSKPDIGCFESAPSGLSVVIR